MRLAGKTIVFILSLPVLIQAATTYDSFQNCLHRYPKTIWSENLNSKAQAARSDFDTRKKLPNNLIYGQSVRDFNLRNKTAPEIDDYARKNKCQKKESVLLDPIRKEPILDKQSRTTPIAIFLCPDGGIIRVKPVGDPTSDDWQAPHATKGLRYPYDSEFVNFDDEVVKIDNDGFAIPKWPKDLRRPSQCELKQQDFIDGWAEDAHTRLR